MSILTELIEQNKAVSISGLGYVGLPLAIEFSKYFKVIAYDIDESHINNLNDGRSKKSDLIIDPVIPNENIVFTADPSDLIEAHFHIVAVPTGLNDNNEPDLGPLFDICEKIGGVLKSEDIVVFENTVYPGCTEEECLPILVEKSGLDYFDSTKNINSFHLAYSPERIVPGDKEHGLLNITKLIGANEEFTLSEVANVYEYVLKNPVHRTTIKVAEMSKMFENIQRDMNISLVNEIALISDKMGIDTHEVIEAASTKWNFHSYSPGLVGGHCIRVDPYYMIYKSQKIGYDPNVIKSGRALNNFMPKYIALKAKGVLLQRGTDQDDFSILIMGVTYKENISDIRNSAVFDLANKLIMLGVNVDMIDPHASQDEVKSQYNMKLLKAPNSVYDLIILAVAHDEYLAWDNDEFQRYFKSESILFDLKGVKNSHIWDFYWKL